MTTASRLRYVPTPYQDATEAGRLILRDGSTAYLRTARPDDCAALSAFIEHLSPEARQRRFFSASLPRPELITALCDNSKPEARLTLLVTRIREGEQCVVATASYMANDERSAEIAFAVDDCVQGLGLGTLLLERLALLAARHGFTRFWAITQADNRAMLDMFRQSGFAIEQRQESGEIEINFSVIPNETSVARMDLRDKVATVASLRPFFRPNAVAVVGASRDPGSIGSRILEAMIQTHFQGPIYPVNPRAGEISSLRAYPSVRDLPEPVDLAVIVVPRDAVLGVVDDCAARGVRAVLIITAGFAETNSAGRELQQRLVEKVRGYGMRSIGPNCLGLLNTDPDVRLNASFSPVFPPAGRVAMSSQSGALGLAILAAAQRLGLGLSTFVSVGNKADVSGNDLLQYWEEDAATDVILLYLESFGNPRRFARIARRVSRRKPIVAIKSGRSQSGGRAAGSHTAALAAREVAVEALFRQTGVIRADTLEEMFDLAAALGSQPLPRGRKVAIVTNAGGPAIMCADACEAGGLVLPELSPSTRSRLATALPASASTVNPVDMIASASPEQYAQVIETVLTSGEVDALIAIYIPVGLSATEAIVAAMSASTARARAAGATGIPVLACLMTDSESKTEFNKGAERIPVYAFPEAAARALGKIAAYAEWRDAPEGVIPDFDGLDLGSAREICRGSLTQRGAGWLSADETRGVLSAVGLPLPAGGVARTAQEAVQLAEQVGYPVAVKLASHQLVHKTEVGGVCLNLAAAAAVAGAFEQIRGRLIRENQLSAMDGVLVQPMLAGGVEVMVGVTQDPLFGPLIAFGLGGVHVEILADVCFRVTPLTDSDAAEMIKSIRGYRLLQGYRGHPPADVAALQTLLLRLSRLVEEIPEISEIDLNPVFALPPGQGCQIADARILVRPAP